MKIYSYGNEGDLPAKFKHVIEQRDEVAAQHSMTVPRDALSATDFESIVPLFQKVSSRLCSFSAVTSLTDSSKFPDIHVVICRKNTQPHQRHARISGVTASAELIGLYLDKSKSAKEPPAQESVQWVVCSAFPHEYYHAVRMKIGSFGDTLKYGPCIVEEGLAQIFQAQEMAHVNHNWAMEWITALYSRVDDKGITFAQGFWDKLEAPIADPKEFKFGRRFPFYPFSFALIAATLKERGESVMDPTILQKPALEILAPWRDGRLDLTSLRSILSPKLFENYFLSAKPAPIKKQQNISSFKNLQP